MRYKHLEFKLSQLLALILYKTILTWLPGSYSPFGGKYMLRLRYLCCKNIFLECGKNVNIERRAKFGSGFRLKIGDNSSIGINCYVPGDIVIGKDVMMGPNCYFLSANHAFDRTDIPIRLQGGSGARKAIIEDDVWIGREVLFTPGRTVKKGSIVAARCVLSKDFPEYSIIGGNPARLIRSRKPDQFKSDETSNNEIEKTVINK